MDAVRAARDALFSGLGDPGGSASWLQEYASSAGASAGASFDSAAASFNDAMRAQGMGAWLDSAAASFNSAAASLNDAMRAQGVEEWVQAHQLPNIDVPQLPNIDLSPEMQEALAAAQSQGEAFSREFVALHLASTARQRQSPLLDFCIALCTNCTRCPFIVSHEPCRKPCLKREKQ